MSNVGALLAECRSRITRVTPHEAACIQANGGVLVDIRPLGQRLTSGGIPGSLIVERNVLEWRVDPTEEYRHPSLSSNIQVVVFCQEGFASSLAVESLQRLGITWIFDMKGGFIAWKASGLTTHDAIEE